jgi:glycosyltransferase involved in cell wall biosynthesis
VVKRVAFAVPGDLATPTGGYAYDQRMIAELQKQGWQIDVIDLGDGFPWPDEATRATAQARLNAVPAGQSIVIDGLALGVLPQAAAQLAGRNIVHALVHHPLALEWGLSAEQAEAFRGSERAALAAVQGVIVTSDATARLVAADYGVPPGRITVAKPGNDPVQLAQREREDVVQLLSVGAVVQRKGFDVLIAALADLTDLPWQLTMAGDRTRDLNAVAELDAAIARYALGHRVFSLGAISPQRLAELYAKADLFVLASRFEGYGMAYAEAIAHGLPVIGTNAGAIPETVPPAAGLLVTPGNSAALAEALRRVICDAGLRHSLAEGAAKAAAQLPTWRHSAEIFARALETPA